MASDELVAVLAELRALLAHPESDFTWSSWQDSVHAVAEIDGVIEAIRAGDTPRLQIGVIFAPTGPAQEVSLSSGWGTKFLDLADRCDRALEES